jgi:uncharacterized membrane protein YvlD (DUF360 family)
MSDSGYGASLSWEPTRPRLRPFHLIVAWLIAGAAVYAAAGIVAGVSIERPGAALIVAAAIALINAVLPPLIAALRLPYTLLAGFILILLADGVALVVADKIFPDFLTVNSFGDALLASIVIAGVTIAIEVLAGTNDDDEYTIRVVKRIARRQGEAIRTDAPGILFLEIDGLALPILRDAMRDGSAPNLARLLSDDDYALTEWETDLSSQTGASQAGILLGSNVDIPAFRWVDKPTGRVMTCSAPDDCAAIEKRLATGIGLLANGGASRGNLLSGEADEVILTVSRIDAEKKSNPGYRAFLANGFNVTRALALFVWELVLEWTAAIRAIRRDVRPRGHRGGKYPFIRAAVCVVIRDLIVFGVLTDMMRGRPAVYATFSSYDEVAHHSGLQRADTLEALRKLDQQIGRIARARRYAPRPYEVVVLSDHGQTQGATFKQRNGYGLDELVERSLARGDVAEFGGGDEQEAAVGNALEDAMGRDQGGAGAKLDEPGAVVLGSGNLGLVYLMDSGDRMTMEEIDERHPKLLPALRDHPHIGWLLVRSSERGAVVLGGGGSERRLADGAVSGDDPLADFSPRAAAHLARTDGFEHVADVMVGAFYDPDLDESCAFEELISFHGGLGGPQTRPFILHPQHLPLPPEPIVGAEAVHGLLRDWRARCESAQ